jgi:hypothetical protein
VESKEEEAGVSDARGSFISSHVWESLVSVSTRTAIPCL